MDSQSRKNSKSSITSSSPGSRRGSKTSLTGSTSGSRRNSRNSGKSGPPSRAEELEKTLNSMALVSSRKSSHASEIGSSNDFFLTGGEYGEADSDMKMDMNNNNNHDNNLQKFNEESLNTSSNVTNESLDHLNNQLDIFAHPSLTVSNSMSAITGSTKKTLPELKKTLVAPPLNMKQRPATSGSIMTIDERLRGIPGGLHLNPDETTKYFGPEGRANFFDRYRWLNSQRGIFARKGHTNMESLQFSDKKDKDIGDTRAFGPSRAVSRAATRAERTARRVARTTSSLERMGINNAELPGINTSQSNRSMQWSPNPGKARTADEGGIERRRDRNTNRNNTSSPGLKGTGPEADSPIAIPFQDDEVSKISFDGAAIDDLNSLPGTEIQAQITNNNTTTTINNNSGNYGGIPSGKDKLQEEPTGEQIEAEMKMIYDLDDRIRGITGYGNGIRGVNLAQHNFFNDENDNDDDDDESDASSDDEFDEGMVRHDVDTTQPVSPRSAYLDACLRSGTNPRASLIVRKNLSKTLHLQHHGMGDEMARIFAHSIRGVPYIHSINLADNNLTDAGLGPILQSLVKIPGLIDLNMSQNVIGPETAECLAGYLGDEKCPLERLVLTKADIDDFECERFLNAIKGNMTLKELDLSNNLLGSAENLNTVMPDLITSGEALAELLRENLVALETLKLAWNMLRLDGAIDLSDSLKLNKSLTYLDLSYNSLGHDGGLTLGSAIVDNKTLKTLLVSNNNLDSAATLTICAGIIENRGLERVSLDGNPIGVVGSRALMLVPTISGMRVKISGQRCNITIRDARCWFDFEEFKENPTPYALNMEHPFERAILMIVLHFIASHRTLIFHTLDVEEVKGQRKPVELIQIRDKDPQNHLDDNQKEVLKALELLKNASTDLELAKQLFEKTDEDGSGELDPEELSNLLNSIGLNLAEERIADIVRTFDLDGGGTIGLDEFLMFLKSQHKEASSRMRDILESPAMALKSKPDVPWRPPSTGIYHVRVVDGFAAKPIYRTLSTCDRDYINEVANGAGDAMVTMTSQGVEGFKVRLDEALNLYFTMMRESRHKTQVLSKLLPQMDNQADAKELVIKALNNDTGDMMRLKRTMGSSLKPMLTDAPTGYYCLDLSNQFDRVCLERLIEISCTKGEAMEKASIFPGTHVGDVSQKMNWMAFRNEHYNGKPITVDAAFGRPAPKSGTLTFDFSINYLPEDEDLLILSDEQLIKILQHNFLLRKEDTHVAFEKLARAKAQTEHALKGNGETIYEASWNRGVEIGQVMYDFRQNLKHRVLQYEESTNKEEVNDFDDGKPPPHESPAYPLSPEDKCIGGIEGKAAFVSMQEMAAADEMSIGSSVSSDTGEFSEAHDGDVEDEFGLVDGKGDVFTEKQDEVDADGHVHHHHSHAFHRMMRKTHKLIISNVVTPEAKGYRMWELLEEALKGCWVRCRHLALIMECFETLGNVKKTEHFGTYRVELLVSLFGQVIDVHNFEIVSRVLTAYEMGCVYARLGMLMLYNPMKPEGTWEMDLSQLDERAIMKTLQVLAVTEPGDNWPEKKFRWNFYDDIMPGWELVQNWMKDEGMPRRGMCTVQYYSGEGDKKRNCAPDVVLRKSLLHLSSVREEYIRPEDMRQLPSKDAATGLALPGNRYLAANTTIWHELLITPETTTSLI